MNNSKFKGKLSSALLASIGLVAIIVIWWLAVKFTEIGLLLPSPLDVLERIIYNCSHPIGRKFTLPVHLLISLRRVLLGFTVASVAGVILGIAMGRSKMIEAIFRPLFELVRPIPSVAWIPLAIVWFGIGESAKFYIIFMAGFVNIVVNTYSGANRSMKTCWAWRTCSARISIRHSSASLSRPACPISLPVCRSACPHAGWLSSRRKWSAPPRVSAGLSRPDRKRAI